MTSSIKKPMSAYFLFCAEKRKELAPETKGLKIGEIQKLITNEWKLLSSEDKQRFIDLAVSDKERYEREKLKNPVSISNPVQDGDNQADSDLSCCSYQLGRVKRIISTDHEVNKLTREALVAIAKASVQELFAEFIATKSYERTLYQNKRQIKEVDVIRAIQTTAVLDWLREDFPEVKSASALSEKKSAFKTKNSEQRPSVPIPNFFRLDSTGQTSSQPHGEEENNNLSRR